MIAPAGFFVIETERSYLRLPRTSDFDAYADFMASSRAGCVGGPIDRLSAWRSYCQIVGHTPLSGLFGCVIECKATATPLGLVSAWTTDRRPAPELSWALWKSDGEGKGIAFEAVAALRGYAYRHLGWSRAISLISAENLRSQSLARRLGCVQDGTFPHEDFGDSQIWHHPAPEFLS